MKTLSVKQPWTSLIADGEKTIEVRTWSTRHRGPLLIAASASPADLICTIDGEDHPLPAGRMICTVELLDCRPMTPQDAKAAYCKYWPGAVAWLLGNARHVKPSPIKGRLNLFETPPELIAWLNAGDHYLNHLN
jgi:hypothetical protein